MKRFSYKKIWLYLLPLLFLPNMGWAVATSFGVLQLNDFIVGPYIISVYLSGFKTKNRARMFKNELTYFIGAFLMWAVFSTLCSTFLSNYSINELFFSLLKLAKLSLYGAAALLTISAISRSEHYRGFHWSLLGSLVVMSVSLLLDRFVFYQEFNPAFDAFQFYTDNTVSATMAILFSYLFALLVSGYGSKRWQLTAQVCLLISIFGFALSNGRGGWVAIISSLIYIFYRLKMRRIIVSFSVFAISIAAAYSIFPQFQDQVDRTIAPDAYYMSKYETDFMGIETGARWRYLKKEGSKVLNAPVFGSGFYHRGGDTGLDPDGSHNFFVQMFLEAGIVGGILTLAIFLVMWRQSGRRVVVLAGAELPAKAAILSAFVVGLSGEYFYGGMILFTLLLSYGIVGRLPIRSTHYINY